MIVVDSEAVSRLQVPPPLRDFVEDAPLLVIVGPTATGKSDLALAVAERLGGEIINADALQVYRGFNIGTAKPTGEDQARVPHHLIDILDPDERYSAGEFSRRAREAMEEIRQRGRYPIVVGGSGLYIRALVEGISPMPPGDPSVRAKLLERLRLEGLEALRKELLLRDPETGGRLEARDRQRILRALEVLLVTGEPLSRWIARQPFGQQRLRSEKIGLTLPRKVLYDLIEGRVRRMIDSGWIQEVRSLLAAGTSPEAPAFQAIGYRQLVSYVSGEETLGQALNLTIQATRRFAKRQMTWFRREPEVRWIEAQSLEGRMSDLMSMPCMKAFGGSDAEAQH